jgi:hypothetical protein
MEAPGVDQQLLYPKSMIYVPVIENVTVAVEPYSVCVAPSGLAIVHWYVGELLVEEEVATRV